MTQDRTPTLAGVLSEAIASRLQGVFTALPAEVTRYDMAAQTVDALPTIFFPSLDDNGEKHTEELPLIQNVPVAFPRGGGYSQTWPLESGDHVLLVFSMLNLGEWFETGNAGDPGDLTLHGLSGAVAIPGLFTAPRATEDVSADAMVFAGPEFRLGGEDATEYLARADRAQTQMNLLKAAILSLASTAGVTPAIEAILAPYTGNAACDRVRAK